jgi:membrane protein
MTQPEAGAPPPSPPPAADPQPVTNAAADAPPAAAAPADRPRRSPPSRPGALESAGDFLRRVYEKAGDDNIFFMAGAIAFNVMVAFVPLTLAVLGIAGTILSVQHADPTGLLVNYILESVPPVGREFEEGVHQILDELIETSTGLLSIGTILLIWLSTRLVGTLRTALREIFDIPNDRGIVAGKIYDVKMVIAAGTLFAVNFALTILVEVVARQGLDVLDLEHLRLPSPQVFGRLGAFITIWAMFILIYRYLPARRTRWRISLVAATFTAVLFELMKQGFAWYATNVADYTSTYGFLANLVILIFWVYYSAVVFILGGEVAQVVAMQRIRRQQKERLR